MKEHTKLYDDFLNAYTSGQTTGEEVGSVIARLAQCYSSVNALAVAKERTYNKAYADIANGVDEESGKPISVAKAEIVAKATDQYHEFNEARKELICIEQEVNALKSLQKGVLQEYAQAGMQ